MKPIIFSPSLCLIFICTLKPKNTEPEQKAVSWAVRMADVIMTRNDSLIHYIGNKPKYEYDIAFFGPTIDQLGNIKESILII